MLMYHSMFWRQKPDTKHCCSSQMPASIMKKITDIKELRSIQLNILCEIHRFCTAHDITYFLSSGTLLGAVRHKGYIPWDDDLDIYMPRASYERFLQQYHDDGRYRIYAPDRMKKYFYTFAKLVDTSTRLVEEETQGFTIGVYVDIFPLDYIDDDPAVQQHIFDKKKLLYKIRRCKIAKSNPLRSKLGYCCYKMLPVTVTHLEKMIYRLIATSSPTRTVCNLTEAGPLTIKGCFPAADVERQVEIEFEGRKFMTMAGYDDYLTHTYGDYMKLPPVEQRVTHRFEAYWL